MAGVIGIETPAIARVFLSSIQPVAKAFLLFPVVVIPPVISAIPAIIASVVPAIPAIIAAIITSIVPAIIPAVISAIPAPSPTLRLNGRQARQTRSNHEANCKKQR